MIDRLREVAWDWATSREVWLVGGGFITGITVSIMWPVIKVLLVLAALTILASIVLTIYKQRAGEQLADMADAIKREQDKVSFLDYLVSAMVSDEPVSNAASEPVSEPVSDAVSDGENYAPYGNGCEQDAGQVVSGEKGAGQDAGEVDVPF